MTVSISAYCYAMNLSMNVSVRSFIPYEVILTIHRCDLEGICVSELTP